MRSKLNHLLSGWPRGTVATQAWFDRMGVSRQLAQRYLTSGWIERVGRGAYVMAGDDVGWPGALYALQRQLMLPVHPGGQTALALKELALNVPFGPSEKSYLFGTQHTRLPEWFRNHPWETEITFHRTNLFQASDSAGFVDLERGEYTVRISSPERAILEVFHLATSNSDFDQAVELTGTMTTFRPDILQQLLEKCRSIKVKRAFLWAARQSGHRWVDRIDVEPLDLGTGKRTLYRGGRLDKELLITVPPGGRDRCLTTPTYGRWSYCFDVCPRLGNNRATP